MISHQATYIRSMAKNGRIKFSGHALDRMGERKIWYSEVLKAILQGEEIENQPGKNKGEDVKILFQEATEDTPAFFVVVACSSPEVEVVTVSFFKEEAWEFTGKIMRRVRR